MEMTLLFPQFSLQETGILATEDLCGVWGLDLCLKLLH